MNSVGCPRPDPGPELGTVDVLAASDDEGPVGTSFFRNACSAGNKDSRRALFEASPDLRWLSSVICMRMVEEHLCKREHRFQGLIHA